MSKTKTIILVGAIISTVGCTTVTQTAQYDIARMQPDCRNGYAMVNYLESQVDVLDTTLSKREARSYRGTTKELIWDTKQDCKL